MRATAIAGAVALAGACGGGELGLDPGLEGLGLEALAPAVAVPGTTWVVEGDAFVDAAWGTSRLVLRGTAGGAPVDEALPATFVDFDRLHVAVDAALVERLGGDVEFDGEAVVEVESAQDGRAYASPPLPVALSLRRALTPSPASVQTGGVVFVNDALQVDGSGFLLGGGEGATVAVVEGCFAPAAGGPCAPVGPVELPVTPTAPLQREAAAFPFAPTIAGIRPGVFDGAVTFENRPASGAPTRSAAIPIGYEVVSGGIFSIQPAQASLGQYVVVSGGGFVGGDDGGATLLRLQGTFTPAGAPAGSPTDLLLVPEFVDGRTVRYVLSEEDALGQAIDLRQDTGTFVGTVTPVMSYGADEVVGDPAAVTLGVAPVRQVVWLDFRPSYVESLRLFGLRAVDSAVRQRILEVLAAAYPAVNIAFRTERPEDFAYFAQVEIQGPDPNGMGLFGYDNSPGKDVGNQRLYDRLGGVNAVTQQDGYPGYGGVFIESLMSFSLHPATGESIPGADPAFDAVFDPFRPDRGEPIVGADLAGGLPAVSGADCPAADRPRRVACAIRVMGSLIGTTLAHEIGHSLGLANPYGEGFHNQGDQPGRLMDGGADRGFLERAELGGQGPGVFCDEEYDYLRAILPSAQPADPAPRPVCY